MKTFHDMTGREWSLSITVATVKRVRDLAEVDLGAADGELIQRLSQDGVLLCNVVFACVKPQADAAGITDEQFAEAMGGDSIADATQAFLEELTAYFPPQRRRVAAKALGKMREVEERAAAAAEARLDSPETEAEITAILTRIGAPSTNSPG